MDGDDPDSDGGIDDESRSLTFACEGTIPYLIDSCCKEARLFKERMCKKVIVRHGVWMHMSRTYWLNLDTTILLLREEIDATSFMCCHEWYLRGLRHIAFAALFLEDLIETCEVAAQILPDLSSITIQQSLDGLFSRRITEEQTRHSTTNSKSTRARFAHLCSAILAISHPGCSFSERDLSNPATEMLEATKSVAPPDVAKRNFSFLVKKVARRHSGSYEASVRYYKNGRRVSAHRCEGNIA
nr:hypothetical protein CFP56_32263 [Quercus suber]